jgi:hypothetical protein
MSKTSCAQQQPQPSPRIARWPSIIRIGNLSSAAAFGETHFSMGTGEVETRAPRQDKTQKHGRLRLSRLRTSPDDLTRDCDAARILQTIELERARSVGLDDQRPHAGRESEDTSLLGTGWGVHIHLCRSQAGARVCARAVIRPGRNPSCSPHTVKHGTATALLDAEFEISVIELWLGLESMETINGYLHTGLAMKEEALAKVLLRVVSG